MGVKVTDEDRKVGAKGRQDIVTFVGKGYRDVIWCPYLNEPAILEYVDINGIRQPDCPNCNRNYESSTHIFICHILKP
jgi:hypothetical protein